MTKKVYILFKEGLDDADGYGILNDPSIVIEGVFKTQKLAMKAHTKKYPKEMGVGFPHIEEFEITEEE